MAAPVTPSAKDTQILFLNLTTDRVQESNKVYKYATERLLARQIELEDLQNLRGKCRLVLVAHGRKDDIQGLYATEDDENYVTTRDSIVNIVKSADQVGIYACVCHGAEGNASTSSYPVEWLAQTFDDVFADGFIQWLSTVW